MALPKVFKVLGIFGASAVLFCVYALTHLSLNLLLRCAPVCARPCRSRARILTRRTLRTRSGTVVCGRMSFSGVVEASLGKGGTLAAQLAVIINNLGGLVVFLIIIGDVLAGRAGEPGLLAPLGCVFACARSASSLQTRADAYRRAARRGATAPWR